jgi:replicative DNA helicase
MNSAHYARIIKDKSVRRGLLKASHRIAELGHDEDTDVETLMDMAEVALRAARDSAPGPSRDPAPSSIIARMEGDRIQGIPCRLPSLNAVTTGMVRGHLWVVGGFSSTGKSAFAVNLVEDVINQGGAVMVASTEMSQEQYLLRLMSLSANIPQRLIRHGGMSLQQGADYEQAKKSWRTAKLRVYDDLYNLTRIRRAARKMKETIGLDVLFVDFVQNLNESGDEIKDARLAAIELQSLAKELQCCVVGLSQLSNSMAFQQANEGINANYYQFKGSGALKDAADIGIMLDRDRNNNPDIMWVHVVKNRHDKLARIGCRFELETGKLSQLSEAEMLAVDPNAGRPSKKGMNNGGGTRSQLSSDPSTGGRDAQDTGWRTS